MKPMIYKATRKIEILDEGVINNFHYCIVSYGTHPCAYIELPETHEYYGLDYDAINIACHGGLTYASDKGIIFDSSDNHRDGFWIGWDYAHYEDYMGALPLVGGRKYTTEDIYRDVGDAIAQLRMKEVEVETRRLEQAPLDDCAMTAACPNQKTLKAENQELRQSVENLQARIDALNHTNKILMDTEDVVKMNVWNFAIKEFAERLWDELLHNAEVTYDLPDNFCVDVFDKNETSIVLDGLVEKMTKGDTRKDKTNN